MQKYIAILWKFLVDLPKAVIGIGIVIGSLGFISFGERILTNYIVKNLQLEDCANIIYIIFGTVGIFSLLHHLYKTLKHKNEPQEIKYAFIEPHLIQSVNDIVTAIDKKICAKKENLFTIPCNRLKTTRVFYF